MLVSTEISVNLTLLGSATVTRRAASLTSFGTCAASVISVRGVPYLWRPGSIKVQVHDASIPGGFVDIHSRISSISRFGGISS